MDRVLSVYENGNAIVTLFKNGTRITETQDDEFKFDFPLSIDCKITNQCKMGCAMCHENSIPDGKHAPLENFKFLESWNSGTEIALGGGSVTLYPYLIELLQMIKSFGIIANITFHQNELIDNFDKIKSYQEQGLIHGIGISYFHSDSRLVEYVNQLDNVVFHVIAGLTKYEDFNYLSENFNKPKILILGYKHFRRGNQLYEKIGSQIESEIKKLSYNIDWLNEHFKVISFDNLALEQLSVKAMLTEDEWNLFYQGDEGTCSMYIDAVEGKFAMNSTSEVRYDLKNDIKEMFRIVKGES